MRIRVTLLFENEAVWFRGLEYMVVRDQMPPEGTQAKVQFCGEWYTNGQTREFEVKDTYGIQDYPAWGFPENYPEYPTPAWSPAIERKPIGLATHIVGEWDNPNHMVLFKHGSGCSCTAHVWSCGFDCGCNRMVASIFTPHELGVKENKFGSVTTSQGVTIAWERIEKEEKHEEGNCRTDGCAGGVADGMSVPERW